MFSWLLSNVNLQTVLIGLVVIYVIYKLQQRLRYRLPPGPFAFPILGNLQLLKDQDFQKTWHEYRKIYGPVFQIQLGLQKMVLLNDINVVTEAMVKKKADFANRPEQPSTTYMSEGRKNISMTDYTPTWKLHRKIAGKAIRQYMVGPNFEMVVHQTVKNVLDRMAQETGAFNPEPFIESIMFNILHAVCFGKNEGMDNPKFKLFMELDKSLGDRFAKGLTEDFFPIIMKFWTSQNWREFTKETDQLVTMIREYFEEHKRTFEPDNIRDLTDTLILARKEAEEEEDEELLSQLTDTHLFQTLLDVLFAGIDTSRMTLSYAVRYMASLPDIQKKCQEEIDQSIGREHLPGMKDRESLPYCEATLHEVMRMGTIAPIGVPHSTLCDTSVGGYDIPKGTTVIINHWELHYDTEFWPDVEKFDPTRYLDQKGKLTNKPESWLPFSAGRRHCLGEAVAKPELHLLFVSILQRFDIKLGPGVSQDVKMNKTFGLNTPAEYTVIVQERK